MEQATATIYFGLYLEEQDRRNTSFVTELLRRKEIQINRKNNVRIQSVEHNSISIIVRATENTLQRLKALLEMDKTVRVVITGSSNLT